MNTAAENGECLAAGYHADNFENVTVCCGDSRIHNTSSFNIGYYEYMNPIHTNPQLDIQQASITEGYDYVAVDDFLQNPHDVIDYASSHADRLQSRPRGGYPGRQFQLDDEPLADVYRFVRTNLPRRFRFFRGDMKMWAVLSLTTTQPDELFGFQLLCHVDTNPHPDRTVFAGLVYLFDDQDLGGTDFYRWKDPDLEQQATALEDKNPGAGIEFLRERFPTLATPPAYLTGSNEVVEHLCSIPARFNRFVFYSGRIPHSAAIAAPQRLSADPSQGRLTRNVFASVVPK